jgi:hypothetical protein
VARTALQVVLTSAVYLPVTHYGFISIDDASYVFANDPVQGRLALDETA